MNGAVSRDYFESILRNDHSSVYQPVPHSAWKLYLEFAVIHGYQCQALQCTAIFLELRPEQKQSQVQSQPKPENKSLSQENQQLYLFTRKATKLSVPYGHKILLFFFFFSKAVTFARVRENATAFEMRHRVSLPLLQDVLILPQP